MRFVARLMPLLAVLIALPGVPREMKAIFEGGVTAQLRARSDVGFVLHRTLLTVGEGETVLLVEDEFTLRDSLGLVVPLQVLLGAITIWSGKQPHLTSLHVMTGALTLALSLVLTLSARTLSWRKSSERGWNLMPAAPARIFPLTVIVVVPEDWPLSVWMPKAPAVVAVTWPSKSPMSMPKKPKADTGAENVSVKALPPPISC